MFQHLHHLLIMPVTVLRVIAFFMYLIDVIIFHWWVLSDFIAWLNIILPLLCRAWACWHGQSPSTLWSADWTVFCTERKKKMLHVRLVTTSIISWMSPLYDRHGYDILLMCLSYDYFSILKQHYVFYVIWLQCNITVVNTNPWFL